MFLERWPALVPDVVDSLTCSQIRQLVDRAEMLAEAEAQAAAAMKRQADRSGHG